jgi:hypothetical protein
LRQLGICRFCVKMVNVKSKSNARSGGAVTSPSVDFINTGHAAQSRYIAALMNPFAAPAVPIPDSFLPAHCAKIGYESTQTGVKGFRMNFRKNSQDVTGDYTVELIAWDAGGNNIINKSYTSEVGARLVAGGLAFEDGAQADSIGGFVTYSQIDQASDGTTTESVNEDDRTERNNGYGSLTYSLNRRQALDFEGNAYSSLLIDFSAAKDVILRFVAIVECDGDQGFTESVVSTSDFVLTQTMMNHHAGVFADTPHPKYTGHLPPILTDLKSVPTHHFSDMWHSAAGWVSSAAGWAWKHRGAVTQWANKAHDVYKYVSGFSGSITAARTGEIMSLGARAAPLLLA